MPVFRLDSHLVFPHPVLREPDGLLAVDGNLSIERLLLAYRWGIFPWFHEDQPILWWWTCPRLMMRPQEVHISHSLRQILGQKKFRVTFNQAFEDVMQHCAQIQRKGQEGGTWITNEMHQAYVALHQAGFAVSVEVWQEEQLVGGLYGVLAGKIFCGESMFAHTANASKVGFIHAAKKLEKQGYAWIDCQQDTPHMRSMGGYLIEEDEYLQILRKNIFAPHKRWDEEGKK